VKKAAKYEKKLFRLTWFSDSGGSENTGKRRNMKKNGKNPASPVFFLL
jgi:ribosomal protein L29